MKKLVFVKPLLAAGVAAALMVPAFAVASIAGATGSNSNVRMPIAWTDTPAQIASLCRSTIRRATAANNAVAASKGKPRSFASVIVPLENATADVNDRLAADTFLMNVSTDAAVRDASQACQTDLGNFGNEQLARPDLFRAIAEAAASKTASTAADLALQRFYVVGATRAGAALSPAKRAEFVSLEKKLNDLQNTFGANLANDASTITITKEQTSSLPANFVATFKTASDGGFIVPVNESTTSRFMQNEADPAARKAFYVAYNSRAAAKNTPLLESAIAVRDRLAHLFGYPNWAAYVLADRMAQTPRRVESFLQRIDVAILPKARAERATLAALNGGSLQPWDESYAGNLLIKTKYNVDRNAVAQYFPVQHTIDSILEIYAELLGVKFAASTTMPKWNPDILAYDVNDAATGRYLGSFYLDLFPRPGKYEHFASFPLVSRRVLPDGSVRAPLAAIVGNWPEPAPGKPALLSHDDVETFFHEFGHNMAAMLGRQPYETLNSGFRADFVEAPSQMLENWVWQPAILKRISSNATTGAPLPDELITKMIAARYVDFSLLTTRQILYATVDMRYHTMGPHVDTTAVWKQTAEQTTPGGFVDGTAPQAGFGHLMSGYDAGYYGYLWSKVYAQDMFTAFQAAGLTNPQVGKRYRDDILAPARTEEPDVEVRNFLGRPMSPVAFYRELGITNIAAR